MVAELRVDTDVLRRHASRVAQVADELGVAQSAAASVKLHDGAFGVLCSFLPGIVSGVDATARDAVSAVREATDAMVTELGAMARSMDEADARVEQRMHTLAQGLGGHR
ncbi:type VII secretion target [Cellulomonas hominis]|uniref:type VII secretion target n=1 Tax=Cellulomonas hominis TaxID=156981 RepID=UPI001BCFF416|nr:type VII secretion target [Cellulomonas hominis]